MSLPPPPPNNFNYPYDPIHDAPPQPHAPPPHHHQLQQQQQQQQQQQLQQQLHQQQQQQLHQHPIYSPQHSFQQSPPIYDPTVYAQDPTAFQPQHHQEHYAEPTHAEPHHEYIPPTDETPSDEESQPPPKQRGRRRKQQLDAEPHEEQAPMNPAPRAVNIKTKFPVARIKRIMQADEDVGKVAQVTPVVVSKALELFMISLCDKASLQARARSSKRITAGHLKAAILAEEQFDFLLPQVEKVPDIPSAAEAQAGGSEEEAEAGMEVDSSGEGAPVEGVKKVGGRRKKGEGRKRRGRKDE